MSNLMQEMKTDESGSINAIRRQDLSLFTIISEILGNLRGSVISIKENEGKLYVFVNDGGMTEKDKAAVRKKYSSGSYNTGGINGIGIRMVIDRISSDNNIILRTINEKESITMNINMRKDAPEWKVSKWMPFEEQDIENYQSFVSELNLTDNKGTLWEIPLNDGWKGGFKKDNDKVKKICRRFFNSQLFVGKLKLFFNSEELKIDKPLFSDKEDKCVKLELTLFHEGNASANGKRVWKITNYDDIKDKYPDLKEYYIVKGATKHVKEHVIDTDQVLTEYERFTTNMVSYNSDTFEHIEKSLRADSEKMKGLWLYINGMCILEESIIRSSGSTEYMNKQYYPIIELHIQKDTKLFDLTSDKSKTKEKKGDGEKAVKLIWHLMKEFYPIPPDTSKISDTPAPEPSPEPAPEPAPEPDNTDTTETSESEVEGGGVLVGTEVDNGNCVEEVVDNGDSGDSGEDEPDHFYICYIVQDPSYQYMNLIPENIRIQNNIRLDFGSIYKYGKLKIKNLDKEKIPQKITESYARGRAEAMKILKYWIINGSGSNAENSIKAFLRGHGLVVDNSCELFNIGLSDINDNIKQIEEHLIGANYYVYPLTNT